MEKKERWKESERTVSDRERRGRINARSVCDIEVLYARQGGQGEQGGEKFKTNGNIDG